MKGIIRCMLIAACVAALVPHAPPALASADAFQAVSAGNGHSLAIKADGSLWAWGNNDSGQIGDGTITRYESGPDDLMVLAEDNSKPAPVKIMDGVTSVSAGMYYSLAVKTDGSLWAWGSNWCGQLGLGDNTDRNVPTQVGTDNSWAVFPTGGIEYVDYKKDFTITVEAVQVELPDTQIIGFNVAERKLAAPGLYDYVVRMTVENQGGAAENVTAVLTGWQSGGTAAANQTLSFGRIESGETVTSANTFTIRLSMTAAFDESKLVFNISY